MKRIYYFTGTGNSNVDRKLLEAMSSKTPIVKVMGLPKRRNLYRNPYINTADLMKNRE